MRRKKFFQSAMENSVTPPRCHRVVESFVIEDFSSKMEHFKTGQCVRKDLPLGAIEISVLPNGQSEESKGWVELEIWNTGEEDVKKNWCRITMVWKSWTLAGEILDAFSPAILRLSQEECRARLKAGAREVRIELELADKVGFQENSLTVVKNDSEHDSVKATIEQGKDLENKDEKKDEGTNAGSVKVVEVDEKVQSKKVNIEKEEAVLKYHKIVIDLKACQLKCSACKTRPRRCKVFQCSVGHLVCEACLPSLQRCPVCNTSLPEPHYRNLCAELFIASIGEVD